MQPEFPWPNQEYLSVEKHLLKAIPNMSKWPTAPELKMLSTMIWNKVEHYEIPQISVYHDGPRPGYDDITDETLTATRRRSSVMMQRRMKRLCA